MTSGGNASAVSAELLDSIPGWLPDLDRELFDAILAAQTAPGDLAELGVYQGKSAVVIGAHQRPSETFTVVDLFEQGVATSDEANRIENAHEYEGLTRARFEQHYLRVHDQLPVVVTGPSQSIVDHARSGTHRFVHIDASHLYEHVVADIAATRRLVADDGVVVLDDIRAPHAPGVAAAAWAAVADGLRPFAITTQKQYATWGDPAPWVTLALDLAGDRPHEVQQVAGCSLVLLEQSTPNWRRWVPEAAQPTVRRLGRQALALRDRRATRR